MRRSKLVRQEMAELQFAQCCDMPFFFCWSGKKILFNHPQRQNELHRRSSMRLWNTFWSMYSGRPRSIKRFSTWFRLQEDTPTIHLQQKQEQTLTQQGSKRGEAINARIAAKDPHLPWGSSQEHAWHARVEQPALHTAWRSIWTQHLWRPKSGRDPEVRARKVTRECQSAQFVSGQIWSAKMFGAFGKPPSGTKFNDKISTRQLESKWPQPDLPMKA